MSAQAAPDPEVEDPAEHRRPSYGMVLHAVEAESCRLPVAASEMVARVRGRLGANEAEVPTGVVFAILVFLDLIGEGGSKSIYNDIGFHFY